MLFRKKCRSAVEYQKTANDPVQSIQIMNEKELTGTSANLHTFQLPTKKY